MLKSKRFWGFLLAGGAWVGGNVFGIPDSATVSTVNEYASIVAPVYMLVTRLIDQAKKP